MKRYKSFFIETKYIRLQILDRKTKLDKRTMFICTDKENFCINKNIYL